MNSCLLYVKFAHQILDAVTFDRVRVILPVLSLAVSYNVSEPRRSLVLPATSFCHFGLRGNRQGQMLKAGTCVASTCNMTAIIGEIPTAQLPCCWPLLFVVFCYQRTCWPTYVQLFSHNWQCLVSPSPFSSAFSDFYKCVILHSLISSY